VRRRYALAMLLALASACAGLVAQAQPRLPLIVVLMHGKESALGGRLEGLSEGLRELGYVEIGTTAWKCAGATTSWIACLRARTHREEARCGHCLPGVVGAGSGP